MFELPAAAHAVHAFQDAGLIADHTAEVLPVQMIQTLVVDDVDALPDIGARHPMLFRRFARPCPAPVRAYDTTCSIPEYTGFVLD